MSYNSFLRQIKKSVMYFILMLFCQNASGVEASETGRLGDLKIGDLHWSYTAEVNSDRVSYYIRILPFEKEYLNKWITIIIKGPDNFYFRGDLQEMGTGIQEKGSFDLNFGLNVSNEISKRVVYLCLSFRYLDGTSGQYIIDIE